MKIDIISVGKLKEDYLKAAVNEYSKRISRFSKINIIEVNDEKTSDHETDTEKDIVLKAEADRINKYIDSKAYVIALCVEGKMVSSEELASLMEKAEVNGGSHIQFVIGGSLGLHDSIKQRADYKLSFSRMTFPHMLMRVILLEQIFRTYKIRNNETYHK